MPLGFTGSKADAKQCGSYRWPSLAWRTASSLWPHESVHGLTARHPGGGREGVREIKSIREAEVDRARADREHNQSQKKN